MAKTNSSLMSWMKSLVKNRSSNSDLIRWAQTEYGNDWQAAYYQMKQNPGKLPNVRGVIQ